MGNRLTIGRKRAKIMKVDGETFQLKTPATAGDATKDHPGYVLLKYEAVKRYGVRAKPMDPSQELDPKKTYFLVELPKLPEQQQHHPVRRVATGVHVSAKDRLEFMMLKRRTASDVAVARSFVGGGGGEEPVRVKVRLPRAEVEKIMQQSTDEKEVAEKIIGMYMGGGGGGGGSSERRVSFAREERVEIVGQ